MSERMSRREMRKAGLLKPKPAVDRDDQETPLENDGTDETATNDSVPSVVPETGDDPVAEDNAEQTGPSDDNDSVTGASNVNDVVDEDGGPDTQVHDTLAESAQTSDTTDSTQLSAPAVDENVTADDDQMEATAEAVERLSVFDRFSSEGTAEPVEETGEDNTTIHEPDTDSENDSTDDEDFAGALRAKLKSKPPAELTAEEDMVEASLEGDDEESPSRWKTVVLFLLLIVVGFGVGILLGSLIFSGGNAQASATPLALYYNPGAL